MNRCLITGLALGVAMLAVAPRRATAEPIRQTSPTGADARLVEFIYSSLKKTKKLSHPQWDYSLSVKVVTGTTLEGLEIEHQSADGTVDLVARAKKGWLRVDRKRNVLVIDVENIAGESVEDHSRFEAERRVWEMKLPPDFGK